MQRSFESVTFDLYAATFFLGQLPTLSAPAFSEQHYLYHQNPYLNFTKLIDITSVFICNNIKLTGQLQSFIRGMATRWRLF